MVCGRSKKTFVNFMWYLLIMKCMRGGKFGDHYAIECIKTLATAVCRFSISLVGHPAGGEEVVISACIISYIFCTWQHPSFHNNVVSTINCQMQIGNK